MPVSYTVGGADWRVSYGYTTNIIIPDWREESKKGQLMGYIMATWSKRHDEVQPWQVCQAAVVMEVDPEEALALCGL